MTLQFPGKLPDIPKGFLSMEVWQPHGTLPDMSSRMTMWGSFDDTATQSWCAGTVFADPLLANAIDSALLYTLRSDASSLREDILHWSTLLRLIYAIKINDVRSSLRKALRQVEVLVGAKSVLVAISANPGIEVQEHH